MLLWTVQKNLETMSDDMIRIHLEQKSRAGDRYGREAEALGKHLDRLDAMSGRVPVPKRYDDRWMTLIGEFTPKEEQLYCLLYTDWDQVGGQIQTDLFEDKNDYLFCEGWDRDRLGLRRPPTRKRLQSIERHMPGCMYPLPTEG